MFGFLRGPAHDRAYRQAYARVCQAQRAAYGLSSLIFLSREAVFLYLLAIDAGQARAPEAGEPTCCRLRRRTAPRPDNDTVVLSFAAAGGMLLAGIKLEDDIRDSRSVRARTLRRWLKRALVAAQAHLTAVDGDLPADCARCVVEHQELETSGNCTLREYSEPTARGFGRLFGAMARTVNGTSADAQRLFAAVGEEVGRAIIAWDCAIDYRCDVGAGRFTPLRSLSAARDARLQAAEHVAAAGWLCADAFGSEATSVRVLRHAWRAVADSEQAALGEPARAFFAPASVYAAFCCPCDDCCDCIACGSACGLSSEKSDCALMREECHGWRRKRPQGDAGVADGDQESNEPASLIGATGWTVTALSPRGTVQIDGKRYPAQCQEPSLPANTPIVVVSEKNFGLIVHGQ